MSVDSKTQTEFKMSEFEPRALEEALGSHYALQVAHQTMKERCQQLQLRLANLEEENLQLRVSKSEYPSNLSKMENQFSTPEVEQLHDKVNQLTCEKSQLVQINFMVATENRKLWSRLSRLTQANQSLGSHLTKISDTLSQHDANGSINNDAHRILQKAGKTTSMLADSDSKMNLETANINCNSNPDLKEQSLEEISLKLINSFLQEKEELEEQYAQMVEIQRGTSFNIHDIGFTYLEEDESTVTEIIQHGKQLQEMKNVLTEQHRVLRSAVENLDRIKSGVGMCNQCQQKTKQKLYHEELSSENSVDNGGKMYTSVRFEESLNDDLQQQLSGVVEPPLEVENPQSNSLDIASIENDPEDQDTNISKKEDRICPMCGEFYPKRIPFDDFQKHVLNHFTDDSDPVLDNFEVIT